MKEQKVAPSLAPLSFMMLSLIYSFRVPPSFYSGRTISSLFLDLPDRDDYPDYYQIITSPMALDVIQVAFQPFLTTDRTESFVLFVGE